VKVSESDDAVLTYGDASTMLVAPSERAAVAVEVVKAIGAGLRAPAIVALIVRVMRSADWATGATEVVPATVVRVHVVLAPNEYLITLKVMVALVFPELATLVVQAVWLQPSLQPWTTGLAAAPSAAVPALLVNVQEGSAITTSSLTARALPHANKISTALALPM